MQKIIVMNAKGGSGKTTIATNLVSFYAAAGFKPVLIDYDPQGSSTQWLERRPENFVPIHGIAAYRHSGTMTRSWQMQLPPGTGRVVVDTPAGLRADETAEYMKGATTLVVPMLSSRIDIDATAKFVRDLLLIGKVRSKQLKMVMVANRVKPRTTVFRPLERFLAALDIPVVAYIRDTVNYVRCSDFGIGIHEVPMDKLQEDRDTWINMVKTIDKEFETMIANREESELEPEKTEDAEPVKRTNNVIPFNPKGNGFYAVK